MWLTRSNFFELEVNIWNQHHECKTQWNNRLLSGLASDVWPACRDVMSPWCWCSVSQRCLSSESRVPLRVSSSTMRLCSCLRYSAISSCAARIASSLNWAASDSLSIRTRNQHISSDTTADIYLTVGLGAHYVNCEMCRLNRNLDEHDWRGLIRTQMYFGMIFPLGY